MVENLLLNSQMSLKEIAHKLGYTDSAYLIKRFQKHYGETPKQYRIRGGENNRVE